MNNEDIYLELCKKYNKPMYFIKAVCKSPFQFIKEEIKSNRNRNVRINNLGKFGIKPFLKVKFKVQTEEDPSYLRLLAREQRRREKRKEQKLKEDVKDTGDSTGMV